MWWGCQPPQRSDLLGFSVLGTEIKASLRIEEDKGFSNALGMEAGVPQALATILD